MSGLFIAPLNTNMLTGCRLPQHVYMVDNYRGCVKSYASGRSRTAKTWLLGPVRIPISVTLAQDVGGNRTRVSGFAVQRLDQLSYDVIWGVKESNLSSVHPAYFWTTGLQPAVGNTPLSTVGGRVERHGVTHTPVSSRVPVQHRVHPPNRDERDLNPRRCYPFPGLQPGALPD